MNSPLDSIAKNQSLKRRFGFAIKGIFNTAKTESSFRAQLCGALVAYPFLFFMKAEAIWYGLFALASVCVLSAELLNTALEKICDRIESKYDPVIGEIKDCAAGAVFVITCGSVLIFISFLCHKFL